MTKRTRSPAAAAEEQPRMGGSYIRNEDGTLTRVEGPADDAAEPEAEEADVVLPPLGESEEG